MIKDIIIYEGKEFELVWRDGTDFSKLDNVTQVYGVLFNDKGDICIVSSSEGRRWELPGGTPESEDGSYEETLIREVHEEADVEIDTITPIGYLNSKFIDGSGDCRRQLRYTARVVKINKQTIDPAYNKILLRKFIRPEEFLKYCPWGKTGKRMIEKAIDARDNHF